MISPSQALRGVRRFIVRALLGRHGVRIILDFEADVADLKARVTALEVPRGRKRR